MNEGNFSFRKKIKDEISRETTIRKNSISLKKTFRMGADDMDIIYSEKSDWI